MHKKSITILKNINVKKCVYDILFSSERSKTARAVRNALITELF